MVSSKKSHANPHPDSHDADRGVWKANRNTIGRSASERKKNVKYSVLTKLPSANLLGGNVNKNIAVRELMDAANNAAQAALTSFKKNEPTSLFFTGHVIDDVTSVKTYEYINKINNGAVPTGIAWIGDEAVAHLSACGIAHHLSTFSFDDWRNSVEVSSVLNSSQGGADRSEPSQPSGGQDDDDAFLAFLEEAAGNVATEVDAPISAPEIELLGGAIAIGQSVVTPDDLVRAIESGFRPAVLDHLIENGFEKGEIERLVAPLRTQQRRRKEGRLSPSESDVTCRLARVLIRAEGTLGNRARAFSWLRRPNRSFADAMPMTLLGTEAGGRRVEELLLRADFGMMA